MLRTGKDYIESLRDGREVWIDGEQVQDVPTHPAFAPVVNARRRIYDLAHQASTRGLLTYVDEETGESCATTSRPPHTHEDWRAKRASVDAILDDAGGVVTRMGDETVGEMWSMFDPAFRVIPWPRVPDCGCELGQRSGTPDGAFL